MRKKTEIVSGLFLYQCRRHKFTPCSRQRHHRRRPTPYPRPLRQHNHHPIQLHPLTPPSNLPSLHCCLKQETLPFPRPLSEQPCGPHRSHRLTSPRSQIAPNISTPPLGAPSQANVQHPLDENQYNLLQHLSQVARMGNGTTAPSTHPHPTPVPITIPNGRSPPFMPGPPGQSAGAPIASSSHHSVDPRDTPYHIQSSADPRQSRWMDGDRDGYRAHGADPRFRGGAGPRGRGRGRAWQNGREDYRSRDRSPGERSRSRSPPHRSRQTQPSVGAGYWRDAKPYGLTNSTGFRAPQTGGGAPGKDEFGRDVRSDEETSAREATQSPVVAQKKLSEEPTSRGEEVSTTVPAGDAVVGGGVSVDAGVGAGTGGGLETFDFSTFDFTSPASWAALGRAWQATNGVPPTQEDLMGFMMLQMNAIPAVAPQATQQQQAMQPTQPVPQQQWGAGGGAWGNGQVDRGGFRGRGAGTGRGRYGTRGRGGYGYGNGRETWTDHSTESDAIVLGGEGVPSYGDAGAIQYVEMEGGTEGDTTDGGSGRMQRVGDKWVFVRGDGAS
ncbi:hypothetical protein OF83DRAFT_174893 [Amylostereum chailletii]|nr:hypothetical protein OF83DRAFT_174893 [Amylostereum chailletii]